MLSLIRSLLAGPAASASVHEAAALMASGATLIDVRGSSEWQSGYAMGAVHVPLDDVRGAGVHALRSKGVNVEDGHTILVICQSGMRSGLACQRLAGSALFRTINVKGGMIAWRRAGLPMGDES